MLTDEQTKQIEALAAQHGKVVHVEHEGHVLVFRRPDRMMVKEYRRKEDSPSEKSDRVDQLAQQTIVAFDAETDAVRARNLFLGFLDEFPMFCESGRMQTAISVLGGLVAEENALILGKGCSIWK